MTANPTYKPSEGKREEFRRYLEKTGVMDALTKCLVSLYEEPDKPTDALHYLINKLSLQSEGQSLDDLKTHLQEALNKISALEEERNNLKAAAEGGGGSAAAGMSPAEQSPDPAEGEITSPDTTEVPAAETPAEQPQEA